MVQSPPAQDEYVIIEYSVKGQYVKVSAIDALTHEEVSIVGDARYSKEYLARQAIKKLRLMQSKR